MGKVAFITGAGGYIGREIAVTYAKGGIKVAVCDISEKALEVTLKEIEKVGGNAKPYVADVSNATEITETINRAAEDFGELDILVHSAGGSAAITKMEGLTYAHLTERDDLDVIEKVISINLLGAIWCSRAAGRIMKKQAGGGKIVFLSSATAVNGIENCCDYVASKGGIMSLTKALAKEMGRDGINVMCVAPGCVPRPGANLDDHYKYGTIFINKMCLASDVADLVDFLTSDKNNFITGQTYVIDGGRTLALKGTDGD